MFLIPAGCVDTPPPLIPENRAAHWNGKAWSLVDYYHGLVVYSITTGEPRTLNGMEPIPSGYTMDKPGPNQVWKNGKWVDDSAAILAKLYQEKLVEISSACAQYIEGGFHSSALGEAYRYTSSLEDQVNLTGLVFSALDSAYPCAGADGVRQFLAHTRAELLQVNKDLVVFKQAALQQADRLRRDAAIALQDKKITALRAIQWKVPA
ncbi:DUF4376 domain-containing protein [Pseudomonas chlororaphis]|uniref:DUF4376 domain-containing protein n=1 Tax=Pseudomonas chlororaphis TaxID=587753 RepID=UPI00209EC2C7|nr:hypothetical protein [Pseudomonas chlororaphis]